MIILQILLTTYILGAALIAMVMMFAVFRAGGFSGFAEDANFVGKNMGKNTEFTSARVQKICLVIIFAWPLVPLIIKSAS
jgi:hypothetical protein